MIGRRSPPNILNDWRLPVFVVLLRVVYHDLAVGDLTASAVKHQLDFPVQGPQGRVADAGLLMPPKSTWFEPKLRSGLLIHEFER